MIQYVIHCGSYSLPRAELYALGRGLEHTQPLARLHCLRSALDTKLLVQITEMEIYGVLADYQRRCNF